MSDYSPIPPFTDERLDQFESFVGRFRSVFQRADQALRFRAYVRGLLEPIERKNVESIATAVARVMMTESNLAQALQHFVSHSPWDGQRLISALRTESQEHRCDSTAVWVVHDGSFAKKGQHSIGVYRQFARSTGKKINCQCAVFVSQVGSAGYFPLASRLYLPATWLRESDEASLKTVPEEYRQPASKREIALSLIDELLQEGEPARPVLAEDAYRTHLDWYESLTSKGLQAIDGKDERLARSLDGLDLLNRTFGLDHFEGRTWQGWHHHAVLVFTAYYFVSQIRSEVI